MQGPPSALATALKAHKKHGHVGKVLYYLAPILINTCCLAIWILILALDFYG